MTQEATLIEKLKGGLIERTNPTTRNRWLAQLQMLGNIIRDKSKEYARSVGIETYLGSENEFYNAAGSLYPLLNRQQRDELLKAHLEAFEGLSDSYIQISHTCIIREPLLLADITIARHEYWPGFKFEESFWQRKHFTELKREIMTEEGLFDPTKVKNDFLVAYALLRKDLSSCGNDYAKAAHPNFLSRVLKGIVALRFAKPSESKEEQRMNRLYELLPQAVHEKLKPLRQGADWTLGDQ